MSKKSKSGFLEHCRRSYGRRNQEGEIAGHVNVSVRRVYVRMASACPMQALFAQCQRRLMALDPA